jgi:hypothetical protein
MMTLHSSEAQLELPFWVDGENDYSAVRWCGANRFDADTAPLSWMINSFQWSTTPQKLGYWSEALHKIEEMENNGMVRWNADARERGMGDALTYAFNFSGTEEGHTYWYEVVCKLRCIDVSFAQRAMKSA